MPTDLSVTNDGADDKLCSLNSAAGNSMLNVDNAPEVCASATNRDYNAKNKAFR